MTFIIFHDFLDLQKGLPKFRDFPRQGAPWGLGNGRLLLDIKWHQFVRNDEVRRLMGQPKLTAIVQSRRLTLYGHSACMDDNADAKRILSILPPEDWRRRGHPHIIWLSTVQQDLRSHNLTLPEAIEQASVDDVADVWCNAILGCDAVQLEDTSHASQTVLVYLPTDSRSIRPVKSWVLVVTI